MAKITFDSATAKSLCTAEEFKLFQQAQARSLNSLTEVQLSDLVTRSRTARDKWRDQSRSQKRKSQATKGQRQTDENARSKQKSALLAEIHAVFVARQKEVKTGEAVVPKGKRPAAVPRSDRKIVHRVVRSTNRENLAAEKRSRNRAAKKGEAANAPASSSENGSNEGATGSGSISQRATKKAPVKKVAAKKTPTQKTPTKKKPVRSAARKKILEIQESAAAANPSDPRTYQKPKTADLTKSAQKKQNRPAKTAAVKSRVSRSGSPRIQGHVSSQGKRSQARRDSK